MPKTSNQKLKILYLSKIFHEKTDENHPLTVSELIEELEKYGVSSERKSVYDDIETLRLFGMDIERSRSKSTGYYLASRTFELAELKLLVDSVQASKFITHKKSLELIRKLESLCSVHEGQSLHRQVYVSNRIKSMNESIYYNIDYIHRGIGEDRKIGFRYLEYSVNKERVFRRGGKRYVVSPLALLWEDENYYMVAYDGPAGMIKHFRVDKMADISLVDEGREGLEQFKERDIAEYSRKLFSMFGGEEETVRIAFENSLIGVVIDRFGRDVAIFVRDESHFVVEARVVVSPQFLAWVAGFGNQARLLSPEKVVEKYKAHLRAALELYE